MPEFNMFEFQGHRDNPEKLLEVLERFTRWWFFAPHDEETGVSFHLVDGKVLQMHSWCGALFPNAEQQYPDYFPNNSAHRPKGEPRKLWEIPSVPKFMKVQHVEMLIRRHEDNAQSHLNKASEYRRLLEKISQESQR